MTNAERIEWMVRFGTADLDFYRAGDWLNLVADIHSFLGLGMGSDALEELHSCYFLSPADELPETMPPGAVSADALKTRLRELQADLKTVMEFFVGTLVKKGGEPIAGTSLTKIAGRSGLMVRITLAYTASPTFGKVYLNHAGPLRDCVLSVALELLHRGTSVPLARCPQCLKMFYRHRKQVFCSRTCTNREMAKRKREKDKKLLKEKTDKKGRPNGRQRSKKG
jgi:hypothetical protein